jgi:hypothetical protein
MKNEERKMKNEDACSCTSDDQAAQDAHGFLADVWLVGAQAFQQTRDGKRPALPQSRLGNGRIFELPRTQLGKSRMLPR